MKKISAVFLCLLMVFTFACCKEEPKEKTEMNVYVLSGPTGVGAANLWEKSENGQTENKYNFTLATANDEIVAAISNKSADIAAVATNLASSFYNRTDSQVTVLAVNTTSVLSILTKGEKLEKITDIKGKTLYMFGQGANPEYILRYVLKENSIDADKDIKIRFVADAKELPAVWAKDKDAVIMAPQPVATNILIKYEDAQISFDMGEEWNKVSGEESSLLMGCVIVRNEFLNQNKEAVDIFLKEYKESIEKALSDKENTGALCEKYKIIPSAAIAVKAIPYCGLTYIDSAEMKTKLSGYLKVMHTFNAKSIGGKLPADNFYYEKG